MIRLISVGKVKEPALESLIEDYRKRIEPYSKIESVVLKDYPTSDDEAQNAQVIERESNSILEKIQNEDQVILLDLQGKLIDSPGLADLIQTAYNRSVKNIVFVIGGSLGVSDKVRSRADIRWKLSANTFPHQIVRLLVLEQVYRAFRILNNHPYHK